MFPLADCPVCHAPLHWSYLLRPLWSQWRCPACRSLLGIDVKRRLMGALVYVPLMIAVLSFLVRTGRGDFLLLMIAATAGIPVFLVVDRARVIERCGLHCQSCGYDLQGQTVPRCPECGRELSEAERTYLETGAYPQPSGRGRHARLITAVTIVGLSLLLLAGLVLHYTAPRRWGRGVATTRPAIGVTSAPASAPSSAPSGTTVKPPATPP